MLKKLLPHLCVILATCMLVFLIIDQVNAAMGFINNQGTKITLIVLMVATVISSIMYIADQRKR